MRSATIRAAPDGFERITWNGRETFARPGEWLARFDDVPARRTRAGDLNGDGEVNLQDFNLLASYFGRS